MSMGTILERRIARLERAAGDMQDDGDLVEQVARLNPVEREQRLLAIRERVKDHPAAWALLTAVLEDGRASQSKS
jgi:hypothetical protein